MEDRYDHRAAERKWQKKWDDAALFRWTGDRTKRKFYVLEMFPYTSGHLHIGHSRNYSMGDTLARLRRAQGYDVLYPMGWDAFGLPAENAAIVRGLHPREFTATARASMKAAMNRLGLSYDWSLEIDTSSAEYIQAQQRLFIRFFERGLVYRDANYVNWCPQCATVLANEQVIGGRCWRCETQVVKRHVPQWFFNIRAYADELLDGLDKLPDWPESVKNIQRSWIGRSHGTEIRFSDESGGTLAVFTTRPDTLFGCTFLALAPEHPWLNDRDLPAGVRTFRDEILLKSTEERALEEKRGVFTGHYAVNPINGERVPIWVANYVVMDYGTGAIMAVPAHDERDFEFARAYGLPVREVVRDPAASGDTLDHAYVGTGTLVNSGPLTGTASQVAADNISAALERQGQGKRTVQYRLQNWSISRQRYWGNPIPIVYCGECGAQPVPQQELPLLLPDTIDFKGTGSPLSRSAAYMTTTCPKCGGPAQRDPDTMDTFVDSSWYFLRFPTPHAVEPFDRETVDRMLPVDAYIGGIEHATLHLMYARFFVKALRDLGLLGFDEPFVRLYNQGMVNDAAGRKQSKSLGNVVEPFEVIEAYGADSLRVYLLFTTAYNLGLNWSDTGPKDAQSFLNRVWRLAHRWEPALRRHGSAVLDASRCASGAAAELRTLVHQTIRKVTTDLERFQFNTSIAALMQLSNALYAFPADGDPAVAAGAIRVLLRLLAPFAPHFAEEVWEQTGGHGLVVEQPWPLVDEAALVGAMKEIAVQVNGRFMATLEVGQDAGEPDVVEAARQHATVGQRLAGKSIRKTIYVPDRLVNFVVA
jgi:leucyl-tRNA synthetase